MKQLLDVAKSYLNQIRIKPDGILVDFTMGNGNDTIYLCSLVPEGTVYAFDIQEEALVNTRSRIASENISAKTVLIHDSHSNVKKYIDCEIDGGMFNLGYLPGGDKSIHTMEHSTIDAVKNAIDILKKGGILVISVYPGHPEGKKEGDALLDVLSLYDKKLFGISCYYIVNSPDSPYVICVERLDKH